MPSAVGHVNVPAAATALSQYDVELPFHAVRSTSTDESLVQPANIWLRLMVPIVLAWMTGAFVNDVHLKNIDVYAASLTVTAGRSDADTRDEQLENMWS